MSDTALDPIENDIRIERQDMERIPDNPELDTEIAAYWEKYFQESNLK